MTTVTSTNPDDTNKENTADHTDQTIDTTSNMILDAQSNTMSRREFMRQSFGGLALIIDTPKDTTHAMLVATAAEQLRKYGLRDNDTYLTVSGKTQTLYVACASEIIMSAKVSTGRTGFGSEYLTGRTPAGAHRILYKIGDNTPLGSIIDKKGITRQIAKIDDPKQKAVITTRALCLDGLEESNKNTVARNIYIHGTSSERYLGKPASGGCIRMRNDEVIKLYDMTRTGTLVYIFPDK